MRRRTSVNVHSTDPVRRCPYTRSISVDESGSPITSARALVLLDVRADGSLLTSADPHPANSLACANIYARMRRTDAGDGIKRE